MAAKTSGTWEDDHIRVNVAYSLTSLHYLPPGIMIILMLLGFSLLEMGAVSMKNRNSVMLKGILNMCVGAIAYYLIGFGFSSSAEGGIMGNKHYVGVDYEPDTFSIWLQNFAKGSACAAIVSSTLAERAHNSTYMMYSFTSMAIIYPLAAAWVWGDGWL
jgi:Amt family ammonium transporter